MSDATAAPGGPTLPHTERLKLVAIGGLIIAKIFPFGFVVMMLPAIYRERGLSLELFWLFSIPTIPFWLKWLVAPVVDRYGSTRLGRRKSWILPCTAVVACTYLSLAFIEPTVDHLLLFIGILTVNQCFVALNEVAVHGYCADHLEPHEQGLGGSLMLGADNAGFLFANVALVAMYGQVGWTATVCSAAALLVLASLPALLRRERPPRVLAGGAPPTLRRMLRRPEARAAIAIGMGIGLQKGLALLWYSAFLVDEGLSLFDIGLATGIALLLSGVVGMTLGPRLLDALGFPRAMLLSAALLLPAYGAIVWLAQAPPAGFTTVLAIACAYELALFPYYAVWIGSMLRWAHPEQAATEMTILDGSVLLGATLGGAVSGFLAEYLGWAAYFVLVAAYSTLSSLHFVGWFGWIERRRAAAAGTVPDVQSPSGATGDVPAQGVPHPAAALVPPTTP